MKPLPDDHEDWSNEQWDEWDSPVSFTGDSHLDNGLYLGLPCTRVRPAHRRCTSTPHNGTNHRGVGTPFDLAASDAARHCRRRSSED